MPANSGIDRLGTKVGAWLGMVVAVGKAVADGRPVGMAFGVSVLNGVLVIDAVEVLVAPGVSELDCTMAAGNVAGIAVSDDTASIGCRLGVAIEEAAVAGLAGCRVPSNAKPTPIAIAMITTAPTMRPITARAGPERTVVVGVGTVVRGPGMTTEVGVFGSARDMFAIGGALTIPPASAALTSAVNAIADW